MSWDWEASGLLEGLSELGKTEVTPLLDEGFMLLEHVAISDNTITIAFPAIRRIYSRHGVFNVKHMITHLSAYWTSDRTRSMMNELNVYNNIDGEVHMLAEFCDKYKPQPIGIEPKKRIKGFKLKK